MTLGLIVVLFLIIWAEFVNGWTDAPNAIATVVCTRSLPPAVAVGMAAVMNLVGVLSGTAVAKTISSGIVEPSVIDVTTVGAAMIGIIFWSTLAARWGLPTSESHALVAGLAGGGLAAAGPSALLWSGWSKVLIGLAFSSFLGFFAGGTVTTLIHWAFRKTHKRSATKLFRYLQILSSAFMAFSHGSNDGQKFMGAFTLTLFIGKAVPTLDVPLWVMLLLGTVMAVGTMVGGWRIIHTMGNRITRLETHQGFAAEMAAASTIELASRFGIPLSTTHTISTSIMGVGAVHGLSAVRWKVIGEVVLAWVLTFPVCALISWTCVMIAKLIF